jgi:hypothetical protein
MERKRTDANVSSAASAMAKKRWSELSEDQRKAAMEKARAERQRKTSKAQRSEIARAAAKARWAKARASKPASASAGAPKRSSGTSQRHERKPKKK